MKKEEEYSYSLDELIQITNELVTWRDGLEQLDNNPFSKLISRRIDSILDLKKIEEDNLVSNNDMLVQNLKKEFVNKH